MLCRPIISYGSLLSHIKFHIGPKHSPCCPLSLRRPCLPCSSFDKRPNDSAVLHKPAEVPNVEPKIDIILIFPAVAVLFNEENNPENDSSNEA